MAGNNTKRITVDRVSNSGNPVADERHNGKAILVPGREPGDELLVRLEDAGGCYKATVVNRYETAKQPETSSPSTPSPSTGSGSTSNLLQLGEELCDEELTIEQRHTDSKLAPNEYPGKEKRKTIATRHD